MTAVKWLDRWFRDNPEATHEEGNKALEQAKEMEKEQMKIELPSDEEIDKISKEEILYNDSKRAWWADGAKWMRDKIQNK